jgi:serine/threonine protein kinase
MGIDPFSDEDPIGVYKNILKGKITFPISFEKSNKHAKSLIKHLLISDLSRRYGNLKDGVNDIKKHKFFDGFRWDDLLDKKIKPSYIPVLKNGGDLTKF